MPLVTGQAAAGLSKTLDELEPSEQRLALTEAHTSGQVKALLDTPSGFRALASLCRESARLQHDHHRADQR